MIRKLLPSLMLMIGAVAAYGQVPPMTPNTFIQDHAGVLTPDQRSALNQKVHQLDAKHIQLGVLIVQTTNGQDIADFALTAGRTYGVGAKDGEHRGLLFTLAIADRKTNIQVSRHLEGYITDGQTGAILRSARPQLKSGDYFGATSVIVDQLISASSAVPESEAQKVAADQPKKESGTSPAWLLLLLLPLGVGAGWVLRRRKKEAEFIPIRPANATPPYYSQRTRRPLPPRTTMRRTAPRPSRTYDDTPSYVPSRQSPYESPSYSSSSDSGSSDSSSFGGSSDFGGGGSSDSF